MRQHLTCNGRPRLTFRNPRTTRTSRTSATGTLVENASRTGGGRPATRAHIADPGGSTVPSYLSDVLIRRVRTETHTSTVVLVVHPATASPFDRLMGSRRLLKSKEIPENKHPIDDFFYVVLVIKTRPVCGINRRLGRPNVWVTRAVRSASSPLTRPLAEI